MKFSTTIKKIKQILYLWKIEEPFTGGQGTSYKNLRYFTMYILASVTDITEEVVKEITTIFYNFIWNCKPDKVPRNTMTLGYQNGGLKMMSNVI